MERYQKQLFDTTAFDSGSYCDFSSAVANAIAGKDILLAIWDKTGANILAIAGQQSLTINRSAETIDINSKDTEGSWKGKLAGMKEWSIEVGGLYVNGDASQTQLSQAFEDGDLVCLKVYNRKAKKGMFGGLAVITDYPLEAPSDDSMTYTITLSGTGKLTDLSIETPESDKLPD
jgi:TP901-1 family phage major tail protein